MPIKDAPRRLGAPTLSEMFAFLEGEKRRAYESVRSGKAKGHIDPDGSVTVIVDAISSVHYDARGRVTYSW